ncbi:cytochrome c [bacterium]|nr:cytochrome c [bacterium]
MLKLAYKTIVFLGFLLVSSICLYADSPKITYENSCTSCHSPDGKPTKKSSVDFASLIWQRSKSNLELFNYLKTEPEHFKLFEFKEENIEKIVRRKIRNFAIEKEIILAKNVTAEQIFGRNCSRCHSATGEPIFPFAKKLSEKDWQDSVSDDYIFEIIENGKGKMPSYIGKLTENEIWAIVKFTRGMRK